MNANMQTKEYTASELKLYRELIVKCMDGIGEECKLQYQVDDLETIEGYPIVRPILDIAVPELKIAVRVMGEVHGMPWAMNAHDEIQKEVLEANGWDVIDVWHSERADLWT
jgi:very-short-patch-repair endonuclease